jgi:hypothetical protein
MDPKRKEWLLSWLIIISFFAVGAAGWWLTPEWSHKQEEDDMNAKKNPSISVFSRELGPPFVLWVDASGTTWKVVEDSLLPNEFPLLHYVNTHEVERRKKVDDKTMYVLRKITVTSEPRQ